MVKTRDKQLTEYVMSQPSGITGLMEIDRREAVLDLSGQGRPLNGGHLRSHPNYDKKSDLRRTGERAPPAEEAACARGED